MDGAEKDIYIKQYSSKSRDDGWLTTKMVTIIAEGGKLRKQVSIKSTHLNIVFVVVFISRVSFFVPIFFFLYFAREVFFISLRRSFTSFHPLLSHFVWRTWKRRRIKMNFIFSPSFISAVSTTPSNAIYLYTHTYTHLVIVASHPTWIIPFWYFADYILRMEQHKIQYWGWMAERAWMNGKKLSETVNT